MPIMANSTCRYWYIDTNRSRTASCLEKWATVTEEGCSKKAINIQEKGRKMELIVIGRLGGICKQ